MEGKMLKYPNQHDIEIRRSELLLEDILAAAEKLPPFPDVMWKVMPLIQKVAPVGEIEAVIKYDQAITARVLALSQSAYYGRRSGISSLRDAIVVLGGQSLLQVVMTACASRYFQARVSGYDLCEGHLWQHSVATALVAEMVARHLQQKRTLTIYTAALLHDIGKTVLDLYLKVHLHCNLSEVRKEGMDILDAERTSLGIDHQKLGEIIAARWRFPPEVVVGIGYHHTPNNAPEHQEVATTLYLANLITRAMEADPAGEEGLDPDQDEVFRAQGINAELVEKFQQKARESLEGIKDFLSNP
jgi:putative nucleotidyltransferase with HDIG domain